jgi:hypothetical protein
MKKHLSYAAFFLAALAHAEIPQPISSVTVPLKEYLELVTRDLIKKPDLPSLTIVEDATLVGDYGKNLKIRFSGSSMGERKSSERLLDLTETFSVQNCKGTAFLKSENGGLSLFPRNDKFTLECDLEVSKWQDFRITVYNTLSLQVDVKGIKNRIQGQAGIQKTVFFEVPLTELQPVIGDISAVGRYRVTVLPEAQNFIYNLDLNNPNRGTKPFEFPLKNGESIRRIDAAFRWEEKKDRIIFQVEPGAKHAVIEGALTNKSFEAPLKEARQYLMIENHPNLQLEMKTAARRISASDASLREGFAASKTYLIGAADTFSWTARQLEIFFSPSLAISSANYNYHLPQAGSPMVQARFSVENRGVPELPLKIPGKPLYLEVAGQPQVLTKDADGNLLVQLPTGSQEIFVQYEAPGEVKGTLSHVSDVLAKPPFLISQVNVSVGSGVARGLMFARSLSDYRSAIDWNALGISLFFFLIIYFFVGRSLAKKARILLALVSAAYLFFNPWRLDTLICFFGLILIFRNRHGIGRAIRSFIAKLQVLESWNWKQWLRVVPVLGLLFVVYVLATLAVPNYHTYSRRSRSEEYAAPQSKMPGRKDLSAQLAKTSKAFDEVDSPAEGGSFESAVAAAPSVEMESAMTDVGTDWQGLPAPITIPPSVEEYFFTQELLKAETPIQVSGITLLKRWTDVLRWFLLILSVVLLTMNRDPYSRWLKGSDLS